MRRVNFTAGRNSCETGVSAVLPKVGFRDQTIDDIDDPDGELNQQRR